MTVPGAADLPELIGKLSCLDRQ